MNRIRITGAVPSQISGIDVYVETHKGNRYFINFAYMPTEEEVHQAWRDNRRNFIHIN